MSTHAYQPSIEHCAGHFKGDKHWYCQKCAHCVMKGCSAYWYHADMDMSVTRDVFCFVPDPNTSALNHQVGGTHYKKLGRFQPLEVMRHWLTPEEFKGYAKGTVLAYLAREQAKGGRQDIEKAAHTLEIYLELTKEEK